MPRQQEGPDWGGPFKETRQQVNLLIAIVQIIAMPLSPWFRRFGTWGTRFAGFHMLLGWLSIPLFILFFPKADGGPLMAVWLATAFMLLLHRIEGARLRWKGYWVPSNYSGRSLVPGDEWKAKGVWEPFIAMCLGLAACLESPPVGVWLISAGVCLGFSVGLAQDEERARIRAMRDARAQAEYEMEILKRELGDE
jgi:hypothetical protein